MSKNYSNLLIPPGIRGLKPRGMNAFVLFLLGRKPRTLIQGASLFIFFLIFWYSIFSFSGSIFSGYHFTDDPEMLRIYDDLRQPESNIFKVAKEWFMWDFSGPKRFKPFYYLHRVAEVWLFGPNFNRLLAYTAFLAVLTSWFLSLFARRIGFSTAESILFALMTLVGKQAIIWWSLGPNETIGMVMLSLSLICMAGSIDAVRGKFLWEAGFTFFTILMSLSKESFILLIPALIFWRVWLYKDRMAASWAEAIRKNMASTLILLLTMSAELLTIFIWTGISGYSPIAGGLDGFKPLSYLRTAVNMTFSFSAVGFGIISLLGILLLIIFREGRAGAFYQRARAFFKDFLNPVILSVLISGPQFVLYARSGFYGRYFLPMVMGYAVFLAYLLNYLRNNREAYFLRLPPKNAKVTLLASVVICAAGFFLLTMGIIFICNPETGMKLYDYFGKPTRALADLLKPGVLAVLGGISIASFSWILLKKKERRLTVWSVIFCLAVFSVLFKMTNFWALTDFSREGRQLAELRQLVLKETEGEDLILIVRDPLFLENAYSIKVLLNITAQRDNIYLFDGMDNREVKNTRYSIYDWYESHFKDNRFEHISDKDRVAVVIVLGGTQRFEAEKRFLSKTHGVLDMTKFTRQDKTICVLYYRPRNAERSGAHT